MAGKPQSRNPRPLLSAAFPPTLIGFHFLEPSLTSATNRALRKSTVTVYLNQSLIGIWNSLTAHPNDHNGRSTGCITYIHGALTEN